MKWFSGKKKTMPNWNDVLQEIAKKQEVCSHEAQSAVNTVRREYLKKLHEKTGRDVIAYYSGFLSKQHSDSGITDEDKNGFMMAIHGLNRSKGLDLILHTPGGDIAATESIIYYLQKMFDHDIRAIVPQIAMSAGTILACSCKQILMGKQSSLGPIDPHLSGIPAHGVIEEFNRAYKEIKADPAKVAVWGPVISKYHPTFLGQCENAIAWSESLVSEQLAHVMFSGKDDAQNKAKDITAKLSDFSANKTHSRHINIEECKAMGLNVLPIETDQELQDIILTVHHTYMHSLMSSTAYKIIENHNGAAFVKQIATS